MINQTDFSEFEVSLPGDWQRKDNGDIYSFTVDQMEIKDERLFRQLKIRPASGGQSQSVQYALTIQDDYCGLLIGDKEFIVRQIVKKEDGAAYMEWEDSNGKSIELIHAPA